MDNLIEIISRLPVHPRVVIVVLMASIVVGAFCSHALLSDDRRKRVRQFVFCNPFFYVFLAVVVVIGIIIPITSDKSEPTTQLPPSSKTDNLPVKKEGSQTQPAQIITKKRNSMENKTMSSTNKDLEAVHDKNNQLVWQKKIQSQLFTWSKAQNYCINLEFDGYSDWRLPTISELESLVDKRYSSSINPSFGPLPDSYPPYFWSSTTDPNDNNEAQFLNFSDGLPAHINKEEGDGFVRCVRQG